MTAQAKATAGRRTCSSCGTGFIGRASASYCSPACKQKAHRSRKGANRNAGAVTVTVAAADGMATHSAEAVGLLAELDAELAEKSAELGLLDPLVWSAAEGAVREAIDIPPRPWRHQL